MINNRAPTNSLATNWSNAREGWSAQCKSSSTNTRGCRSRNRAWSGSSWGGEGRPGSRSRTRWQQRRNPYQSLAVLGHVPEHRTGWPAPRASGHNRTTDLALRYAGKLHPEEVRRRRAFLHGSPVGSWILESGNVVAEALAVSLDKPLEWAVGFFFGNTELSLGL